MMGLQERQTTESIRKKTPKRLLYERQQSEVTRLKLQHLLERSKLVLLVPLHDVLGAKRKYPFRCACGVEFTARPTDMFRHKSWACKSCTFRARMKLYGTLEEGKQHLAKMTKAAAKANRTSDEWLRLYARCNNALSRCTSLENEYYGGRGIEFHFSTPKEMAEWIRDSLGYPAEGMTLDRINNNGHYERGNLRWASHSVQGNNKRRYAVSEYGERVRTLCLARPDYHVNTIRTLVRSGLSDIEIIERKKWDGCGKSLRHTELWSEK